MPKHTRSASHNHDDARLVVAHPIRITAGGSKSQAPIQAVRLVLAGDPKPIIQGLPGYTPIHVRVDWPDMSVPNMSAEDWRWLAGKLRALRRPIHVSCQQGHGRTGTALVLLAHFYRAIPKGDDPVAWVREAYCESAVETNSQLDYIELVTGRKTSCKPAWAPAPVVKGDYRGSSVFDDMGGDWNMVDGWKPKATNVALAPVSSSALDDVRPPVKHRVRYCGHSDKGKLCDKPAREDGSGLCDKHYYERES